MAIRASLQSERNAIPGRSRPDRPEMISAIIFWAMSTFCRGQRCLIGNSSQTEVLGGVEEIQYIEIEDNDLISILLDNNRCIDKDR